MPKRTPPAPDVSALLAALGETPDAVAATLRAGGCRGHRKSNVSCPVARYLTAGAGYEVTVAQSSAIGRTDPTQPLGYERWDVPAPVAAFITAFDRGHYPDLETPDDA